jgi:Family of unknown function (DUF5696)
MRSALAAALLTGVLATGAAQTPDRASWGGQQAIVSHDGGVWTIAGRRTHVTVDAATLAIDVRAGRVRWTMTPASRPRDLIVRRGAKDVALRLADATHIAVAPYDPGSRTGVKITLSGFSDGRTPLDVSLFLTLALEGRDEDLTFDVAAREGNAAIRQLNWPPALDAGDVDYAVLNNGRGLLLPRTWPAPYNPVRPGNASSDTSEIESNLIETWSMPWWGFLKGSSAMMVIVETPDDAAYQFEHPAGGPTVIGPRWRASLGRFRYSRAGRMCFVERGGYVDLAKRYRRYAIESGLFVSLKEKAARSPKVASLVGAPQTRLGILRNLKADSDRYDTANPEKNRSLTTYDERIRQLRDLKTAGVDRLHVVLTGWPTLGYDRQHPDGWPPSPEAGGWEGLRRFSAAMKDLGYLFSIHDQYRDYYVDAPSWDPQFAVHEEDETSPPHAFPGTRFGVSKEGAVPYMRHWDGGKQSFLTPRLMLGHVQKNYALLFDRGIRPDGSYLDVFGYVPPDEDFNPEHPVTRAESIHARAACYTWVRANLGLVGTEAAVDWVIPYVDYSSPLRPPRVGIPVPLFDLVYHDAIITPFAPSDLRGFLDAGLPQASLDELTSSADRIRAMATLEQRLAFVEMTSHEFLDTNHRRERSTYADGTTVTVDWDANTYTIKDR